MMQRAGPAMEIPPEYRETVTALLQREPQHRPLDDASVGEGPLRHGSGTPFSLTRFLYPYRFRIFISFVIVVCSTFVSNVGPLIFAKAIDDGIVARNFKAVLLLGMVYLGTVVLRIVLRSLSTLYIGLLGQELLYRLRLKVFVHLQRLSHEYHNAAKSGHTLAIMTSDISTLSKLLQDGLINFLVQALMLVIITGVLFYMDVSLALILLCTVVPAILGATLWFRRKSKAKFREARSRNADVVADLRQSLYGIKQIHLFNRADLNIREHDAVVSKYQAANGANARMTSLYSAVTDFIEIGGQAIVLYFGFVLVLNQSLTIGELVAFAFFLSRFFAPLEQLALLFRDYQSARAAMDKIEAFLSIRPTIVQSPDAHPLPPVQGAIRFDKVSFGYQASEPVLQDIDLEIRQGETLAIVGPTGGGKSTLVKLLARLLDPTAGVISIDGHDIKSVTLDSLRSQIGVVQQDAFVFHGSLKDNITFANPGATAAQIEAACRSACLTDIIAQLPQGLDSSVHEQGTSLSAGERQLVAIARLLLANPRIILMDEATSNVDPKSERDVEMAMASLVRDRTTIVVTHRLSSIRRADRVAVIGDRQILEIGTHAELMARHGVYAAMVTQWQQGSDAEGQEVRVAQAR